VRHAFSLWDGVRADPCSDKAKKNVPVDEPNSVVVHVLKIVIAIISLSSCANSNDCAVSK